MTWVIGQPTIWNYGILISDICVTFTYPNGTKDTLDCLQKIYRVGNFFVAGFSGSVKIGFQMLQGMHYIFPSPDPRKAWIPGAVGRQWQEYAQRIYAAAPPSEREAGCELIIVGIHPNKNIGAGLSESLVIKMTAPDFSPNFSRTPLHIGSGSTVEEYQKYIQQYIDDPTHNFSAHGLGNFGFSTVLSIQLTDLLKAHPKSGVSQYIQFLVVQKGKFTLGDNSRLEYDRDGKENKIELPPLARTYEQFKLIIQRQGIAEGAVATA